MTSLTVLLFIIGSTHGGFVYFHHYLHHRNAYMTCKKYNMRLVQVDTELKHHQLMNYTLGMAHLTFGASSFLISLKYNMTTSQHLLPDGTVNPLVGKWKSGEPSSLSDRECVAQHSGQSNALGQWHSTGCENRTPFICETGYPMDPDIDHTDLKVILKLYRRTTYSELNLYPSDDLKNAAYFESLSANNSLVIKGGNHDDDVIYCALGCLATTACSGYISSTTTTSATLRCIYLGL